MEKKLKHDVEFNLTETDEGNDNKKWSTYEELLLSEMSNYEITVDNTKDYWKLCDAESDVN